MKRKNKKRIKKADEKKRKTVNVKGRAKHKQKKKLSQKSIKKTKRHKKKEQRTRVHHYRKHNKPIKRKIKKQKIREEKITNQTLVLTNEDLKKSFSIFRSYDIRGIYQKDLSEEVMYRIGNAFASKTEKNIVV